jgi:hypothetical protein
VAIRICDIAEHQETNARLRNSRSYVEPGAPDIVQAMAVDLFTIQLTRLGDTNQAIIRNLALVGFAGRWIAIQERVRNAAADDGEMLGWLKERRSRRGDRGSGKSNISMAKAALADSLGITSEELHGMLRDAQLPSALVGAFGRGSLMLLPSRKGK